MKEKLLFGFGSVLCAGLLLSGVLEAQGPGGGPPPPGGPPPRGDGGPGGPPGGRKHTANEAKELDLVSANRTPPAKSRVDVSKEGESVKIRSNGIPDHKVGRFPNRGNPNEISEQENDIVLPTNPEPAEEITFIHSEPGQRGGPPMIFGITLDGVMMEPGTAEFWQGDRAAGWNYEALGGAVPLGLDTNYGHVQPTGMYHYHGIPTGLMRRLGFEKGEHSPMIGWAADGFPIYALFGFGDAKDANSAVKELTSSYRLKKGERPANPQGPGGEYDGAFVQDYEFVEGVGDLDECNGRFCVTPEFPEGTYAYFMTNEWPVIPRAFRGTPEQLKKPGRFGPPPGGGPGRRGERPPPPQER